MRATLIPPDEVPDGYTTHIIGPPDGHDPTGDIRPVEAAITYRDVDGVRAVLYRFRFELDPGDLELLAAGVPIWLTQVGGIQPFDLDIGSLT
jgi:hypothetical protein